MTTDAGTAHSPARACYHYPSCADLGQLCIYDGMGHRITPSLTSAAWTFLTGTEGGCHPPPLALADPASLAVHQSPRMSLVLVLAYVILVLL